MPKRPRSRPRPTDAELDILQVLWECGPSTVREVHETLASRLAGGSRVKRRAVGYTTTLKMLQIMFEKGLVRRDESQRTHVYEAAATKESTQRAIAGDLLDRVFGGSARALLMGALSSRRTSRKELDQIRRLLEDYEEK